MANTIGSFLVGVGFDFDKKSERQVDSAIDGVKSSALQLGAILGGAFGIKAVTADFADFADSTAKFTQVFGGIPGQITALGRALEHEGAAEGLQSIMSQLSAIERMRARLQVGDTSWIAQAGIAGVDWSAVQNAESSVEAYIALADQMQGLSRQQRLNVAEVFGLDDASIRLLSQGSGAVREMIASEQQARPLTESMTESAAEFNKQWQNLNTNIGGFADNISDELLPAVNDILAGMNEWLDVNREFINQGMDTVLEPIAENLELVAIAGGLLASKGLLGGLAVMSRLLPGIAGSLKVAGLAAGRLALPIAALTAASEAWDWDANDLYKNFGIPHDVGKMLTEYNEAEVLSGKAWDEIQREKMQRDIDQARAFPPSTPAPPIEGPYGTEYRTLGGTLLRIVDDEGNEVPIPEHMRDQTTPDAQLPEDYDRLFPDRSVDMQLPEDYDRLFPDQQNDRAAGQTRDMSNNRPSRVVIENKTYLDGQVIDRRIRDVTEELNGRALRELETSTDG